MSVVLVRVQPVPPSLWWGKDLSQGYVCFSFCFAGGVGTHNYAPIDIYYLKYIMTWLLNLFFGCVFTTWFNPEECAKYLIQIVEVEEAPQYTIWVVGYPEDSLANEIVNYWRDQSNWDMDMILTFIAENWWFDATKVSKTNDRGLCQLHWNKTNRKWIEDERWSDPMYQAEVCVDKWLAVPDPSKVWYGRKVRNRYKDRIYFFNDKNG